MIRCLKDIEHWSVVLYLTSSVHLQWLNYSNNVISYCMHYRQVIFHCEMETLIQVAVAIAISHYFCYSYCLICS